MSNTATKALHIHEQYSTLWLVGGYDCNPNYDPLIQEITSDTIKKFSIDNKIPYVEYSRAYLTDNFRGLYTPSVGHFNGKGYRQIGEDIFNKFVTK